VVPLLQARRRRTLADVQIAAGCLQWQHPLLPAGHCLSFWSCRIHGRVL